MSNAFINCPCQFYLSDYDGKQVKVIIGAKDKIFVFHNDKLLKNYKLKPQMMIWVYGKLINNSLIAINGKIYIQLCECDKIDNINAIPQKTNHLSNNCMSTLYKTSLITTAIIYLCIIAILKLFNLISLPSFGIALLMSMLCSYTVYKYFKKHFNIPKWPKIGHWQLGYFNNQPVGVCGYLQGHN